MSIVETRHLTKCYGAFTALRDLSLSLPKGKIVGLLGPNGSGKTTFIKLMVGLLQPTAGEILVDGKRIGMESKRIVSYLPERNALPLSETPEQLIEFFSDMFPDFDAERCSQMLRELEINTTLPLRTFSKGMREKVQLSLVMSRRASIYVLDEPIAGVDPAARQYILDTIFKNREPESTLLISTHLIRDIEDVLDEFVFIRRGELVCYDSVANVHERGDTVDSLFKEVFKWENC